MTSPQELATAPLQGVLVNLVQLDDSVLEPYLEMLSDPEGRRLTATKEVFSRTLRVSALCQVNDRTDPIEVLVRPP